MPCFLALYEIKGITGNADVANQLLDKSKELISGSEEKTDYLDRSFNFVSLDEKIYLRVLLAPSEDKGFGCLLARYLKLPPVEYVDDVFVYEDVDRMIQSSQ
ncbi:hypothetical protein ACMXYV_07525 [Neptuniibacter sp. SY11_33]|uniref:hypothetical protein n=1 Tax=Neptuniibacter sp. SY11_33 TaxID=3398215 RepID=UPI0039F47572